MCARAVRDESLRVPRPRNAAPDDPDLERAYAAARAHLAQNLRRLRARSGDSQARVAERGGVSLVYLTSLEGGRRVENPSLRALAALAHAHGCPIGELIDPPPPAPTRARRSRGAASSKPKTPARKRAR